MKYEWNDTDEVKPK